MKFQTYIERKDLMLIQTKIYWQSKPLFISLIVWTAINTGFLIWLKGMPQTPESAAYLAIAGFGGAMGSIMFIWLAYMLKTYFLANSRDGVLGAHDFDIREDGLFESTSANETLTRWSAVKGIHQYGDYICVEIAPELFHLISRNSFASETEFKQCIQLLKSRTMA